MQKKNYFEINSNIGFKNQLDHHQIFGIIEAGITFFLYQRGQIPLPFERLHLCPQEGVTHAENTDGNTTDRTLTNNMEHTQIPEFSERLLKIQSILPVPDDNKPRALHNRERMRFMIKQKKLMQQQKREIHSKTEMFKKESYAKKTVGLALERLRSIFVECGESKLEDLGIMAIILLFGPSVHSPKEIIRFEIDELGSNFASDTNGFPFPTSSFENPEQASSLIRNFYKSLILSPDFLDFTSKSLTTTYTHICLQTKAELNNKCEELIRLENMISNSWINSRPNKKLLRIKLTRPSGTSLKYERISPIANNDNYLFDKNSLCFYQIPLRFKGVKCKSKPVM